MRHTDKSRKKKEILIAITTGNDSTVGGITCEGDIYQNCTINIQTFLLFSDQGQTSPQRRLIMEKEKNQEIIAYRIGESLYCPDCYEKSARDLKAVQNPEEPEVKFPSKPIKAEDIEIFICNDCKTVKGGKTLSGKDLDDLCHMIYHCAEKASFISSFFIQKPPGKEPEMSERNASGLYWLLEDFQDDLKFVADEIFEMMSAGKIKEVS